jgi:L-ascorbate metabolism protein UlaG (beta-lactamase superfamily)
MRIDDMFEIEYKGAGSVVISTKTAKLVTDPKLSIIGLKDTSVKGAVELLTEDRFAVNDSDVDLLINGPGEYGVSGFDIQGIPAQRCIDNDSEGKKSTIYRVEIGDARIGIIGNISNKLSDDQLEQLGVLDILIIPVGGNGYTLDAINAINLIKMIDPKIVIPVHYADPSLNYEVPQDELKTFLSELGAPTEIVPKYKAKQLPTAQDVLSVIEITRSN